MKPLIINHAVPMAKVRIITLRDSTDRTLKTLHKIGVMQIEESKELKPVDRAAIESQKKEVRELLNFASNVLAYLPGKKPSASLEEFDVIYTKSFRDISDEVRLLYSKFNSLQERISKLDTEAQKLAGFKKYLEPFAGTPGIKLKDLNYSGLYLTARVFTLSTEAFKTSEERLKKYTLQSTSFAVENEAVTHIVAETKDQKALEAQINEIGGKILDIPVQDLTLKDFLAANENNLKELNARMSEQKLELEKKVGDDLDRIFLLREVLAAEEERLSVLEKGAEAKYVSLISGWVPQTQVGDVISGVRQEVPYAFIDSRPPEDSEQPPTKMDNAAPLKPFQLIVDMFGTPKYREWDPTPIVAFSFAVFFGIMTQDIAYSIGIMLVTKFMLPKFVDNPNGDNFKLFQRVL